MDNFKLDLTNKLKEGIPELCENEFYFTTAFLENDLDDILFSDPRLKENSSSSGSYETAIAVLVIDIRIPEEDSIPDELLISSQCNLYGTPYDDYHTQPPCDIRSLNAFILKVKRAYSVMIEIMETSNDDELLQTCCHYLWEINQRLAVNTQLNYPELFETALYYKNDSVKETLMDFISQSINMGYWNDWHKYVLHQPFDVVDKLLWGIDFSQANVETDKVVIEYLLDHAREGSTSVLGSWLLFNRGFANLDIEIYTKRLFEIYKSGYDVLEILQNAFKPKLTPNWIEVINYVYDRSPLDAIKILIKIDHVPDEFVVEILERVTHKVTSENAKNVVSMLCELREYEQTEAYLFKTIDKIAQINTEIVDDVVLSLWWSEGLLSYMLLNHSKLHNALLILISSKDFERLKPLLPELVPYVVANIDSEVGVKAWYSLCRTDKGLCSKYRDLIPVCCKYDDTFCIRLIIQTLSGDELIQYLSHLIPRCCRSNDEDMMNLFGLILKVGMENLREFESLLREMAEKRKGEYGWYALTFYLTMLDEDKSKFTEKFPEWQKDVGKYLSCGMKAAVRALGPEFLKGLVPILASYDRDYTSTHCFNHLEPVDYLQFEPCKNELMAYFSNLASKGDSEALCCIWRFVSVLSPDRQMVDTALQASTKLILSLDYYSSNFFSDTFNTIVKLLNATNLEANTAKDFIEALLRAIRKGNIRCQGIFDVLIAMVKLGFHLPAEKLFAALSRIPNDKYYYLRGLKLLLAVAQYDESAIEPFGDNYASMLAIFCFYSSEDVREIAHKTLQSFSEFEPFERVLNEVNTPIDMESLTIS